MPRNKTKCARNRTKSGHNKTRHESTQCSKHRARVYREPAAHIPECARRRTRRESAHRDHPTRAYVRTCRAPYSVECPAPHAHTEMPAECTLPHASSSARAKGTAQHSSSNVRTLDQCNKRPFCSFFHAQIFKRNIFLKFI